MKNPGARAMIIGALLSIPSIILIIAIDDNNVRRRLLPFAFAGVVTLAIGIIQYLSYTLRSKEGKAAYRAKWGARGLYHSLVITAIYSGGLTSDDLEHIKRVYNETTGLTLADKKIREIAKRIARFPDNFFKDMKLYANRIQTPARENIIRHCIALAIKKDEIEFLQQTLHKITTHLKIEPEFLALETKQMLQRDKLGIDFRQSYPANR